MAVKVTNLAAPGDAQSTHARAERGGVHSEQVGGAVFARDAPAARLERQENIGTLLLTQFLKRANLRGLVGRPGVVGGECRRAFRQGAVQIEMTVLGGDDGTLHDVFEL